ncbi:MAG TPA: c-type cytochrome [Sulfuriferula sp.]|nr:c-type cytochrome [Sulfuriferula sp.]
MKKHIRHHSITVVAVLAILAAGAGVFVYSGLYNIGADDHHTKPVFAILQTLRDRSIHVRSEDIKVPNLDDSQLILKGAGQYAAMCTDCHLNPGMTDSEIRPGLYPQPPNLSQIRIDPKDAFWVIKHGLKMSAMPAWGFSHDDATIWSMVAFVEKLPGMTPAEYDDIVARAPPDEDMKMPMGMAAGETAGHSDGDAAASTNPPATDTATMPGMTMPAGAGRSHAASAEEGHEHADAIDSHVDATTANEAPLLKPASAPEAEAVALAFRAALKKGDRATVLALLASDASISEGGRTQSRYAYAKSHLGEDIAFLKSVKITPISFGSMLMGDNAMVGSESNITTTINGTPITLRSRELLHIKNEGKRWRIVSIQWQTVPITQK